MPNEFVIKRGFISQGDSQITGSLTATSVTGSFVGDGSQLTGLTVNIPQTDVIYIDSVNGVNDLTANRGQITKPYATVEFALSNTTNTGTVTGNTTNSNNTITSVNDTTNIVVGQYITGTNIPYNTTVISKTSNTIVLSQNATGSGSSTTLTWWTPKLLKLSGAFTATSNWFKQGFYFDSNPEVSVQWGAFSLYEVTGLCVIPYINNSDFNYYGTTSSSRWFYTVASLQTSDVNFTLRFNSIYSNTTSNVITLGNASNYFYGTFTFTGKLLNARFGSVCSIGWSFQNTFFNIDYSYGLLGGVSYSFFQGTGSWNGVIVTPASVYAINDGGGAGGNILFLTGSITGSVIYNGKGNGATKIPFYPNIGGSTTCTLKGVVMYGNVPDNCILNGNVDMYGFHSSYLYVDAGYNKIFRRPQWGIVVRNSAVADIAFDMGLYNLQLQNTSKCIINANVSSGGASVASGSKLIVNGDLTTPSITLNGELVNEGNIFVTSTSITISSTGILRNYRKIESTVVTNTIPLILKDGGNLYLYPGSYLKVANSKGPLKCSANTSSSKNIYLFNCITNSDGSTYGLLISFDGSSFPANDLVGGILYENTSF